jgi:predicted metal-dependent enzyme (double-stranded beta helix superfamily)
MVRGAMVIARGARYGTLYKLDACTVECNSTSMKRESMEEVGVSPSTDGHGFWVLKGALYSKSKFHVAQKLCCGTKELATLEKRVQRP